MNTQELCKIIDQIHFGNDSETALSELIEKFEPLLNKYAHELKYDCAKSDLIIFLIQLIRHLDFNKINHYSDGQLVTYIVTALRNKKIDLHRRTLHSFEEIHTETIAEIPAASDWFTRFTITQCLKKLSPRQRNVIIRKYYLGYSDIEIAEQLHITRQAVNRTKTRALRTLKEQWVCD